MIKGPLKKAWTIWLDIKERKRETKGKEKGRKNGGKQEKKEHRRRGEGRRETVLMVLINGINFN